jgi:hypothetical protein
VRSPECTGKIICQKRSRVEAPPLLSDWSAAFSRNEGKMSTGSTLCHLNPLPNFFRRPACQGQDLGPFHEMTRPAINSVGFRTAGSVHDTGAGNVSQMGLTKMACHYPCRCSAPAKYLSGVGRSVIMFYASALPKTITAMAQWGYVPVTISPILGMSFAVAYKLRESNVLSAQTAFGAYVYIRSYTRG